MLINATPTATVRAGESDLKKALMHLKAGLGRE